MQFIEYPPFKLEYLIYGSGHKPVIFFHGFGRTASDAAFFLPLLKEDQVLLSVNLFAHGKSEFPSDRMESSPLTILEWKKLVELLLAPYNSNTKIHLIGYSMGGRVAMMTSLIFPERTDTILLLAPDGFKINNLYRFAVGTAIGKWLYRRLIQNPKPLFFVATILNNAGIINDKLLRFVHVHLDTVEKRWQVHDAWLIYRNFFPDLDQLANRINDKCFRFNMIFGKYDSVIKPELGLRFQKKIYSEKQFHVVETGHRILEKKTLEYITINNLWPL